MTQADILFRVGGIDVDRSLFLSCIIILLLGLLQLLWPTLVKSLRREKVLPPTPVIETVSEDPPMEKPRKRFVKDKADIASWAAADEVGDPNTLLPAGLETPTVTSEGHILDLDGSVIEEGRTSSLILRLTNGTGVLYIIFIIHDNS